MKTNLLVRAGNATTTLKDTQIKQIIKSVRASNSEILGMLRPCRPDAAYGTAQCVHVVEYENSSRGMSTHILKYARLAAKYPNTTIRVLIIQTLHHQTKHLSDLENAKAAQYLNLPNLEIRITGSGSLRSLRSLIGRFALETKAY